MRHQQDQRLENSVEWYSPNTVYEKFFQGYSVAIADTHGIVYTPQEIVDFMCAAVEEVLANEFGKKLGDDGIFVIDPCTGTGSFVANLLRRAYQSNPKHFERFYREQLFANEVMLMPYYIASLNVEHEYYDLTGHYEPFEGVCFVDTLDLAEGAQMRLGFMTEANTARVERQKQAPITVIIGNPPYNVGQLNENDNNKNRVYQVIDGRIQETYVKDSAATLKNKLYDPYVKFFRWATDRLGQRDGILCFVSNNSFVDQIAFDGMRKHLLQDFSRVYHADLHGNVRQNPKLSGTTHNVFGIQVGVGITVAIRSSKHSDNKLFYRRVQEDWRKGEKLAWLIEHVELEGKHNALNTVMWDELAPDEKNNWLISEYAYEFDTFLPVASKGSECIFQRYSLGVSTNRDSTVYDFDQKMLEQRIELFCENYNAEVDRYRRSAGKRENIDTFVDYGQIKWSSTLKRRLQAGTFAVYSAGHINHALYRPFTKQQLYYDDFLIDRPGLFKRIFPTHETVQENRVIAVTSPGSEKPFAVVITNALPDLHLTSPGTGAQCFPFYVYDEDGGNRRENITDWALAQFRLHYGDDSITKWAIFYYVYGLLHHPAYRARYADNLKRELPRIPFAPDFWAFSHAGKKLADLHLKYEDVQGYDLTWETKGQQNYRVEKMRLNKEKTALKVNDYLTLTNIPAKAFKYRLGNRSALEWVIDQYQVKKDERSGITSDPNDYSDNNQYIVDLVDKVVRVSVDTVQIVDELAKLDFRE